MDYSFIPVALAQETETHLETTTSTEQASKAEEHEASGLSIDPAIVIAQMFNFIILLVILKFLLYKPLLKVMQDREKRIDDGLENAERADQMLSESEQTRLETIKAAKVESHSILDSARKSAEEAKSTILQDAESEAAKIIKTGQNVVEMERSKAAQELKIQAVDLIIQTAEKVLKEKIDPLRDQKLIEDSLKNYSL